MKKLWQYVRNAFSWKKKSLFWRIICSVITLCVFLFTCMLGYSFYVEYYVWPHRNINYNTTADLSPDYAFCNRGNGKGYIYEKKSDKKILEGLDWIAMPEDGDSLVVFSKDGKRGFLSRNTAKIIIPAMYDAAWSFNDGIAGVCKDDSVYFIDHSGRPINSRKFKRVMGHNYIYHGNYFANQVGDKFGLVDRRGNDATPVKYESLFAMANNMWAMRLNGKMGIINDNGVVVVPNEYAGVEVYPEGGIVVMMEDNSKKRMDYEGNITDEFVYDFTENLDYDSDEIDLEGNRMKLAADMRYYSSNGHLGLMDKGGRPVTPPIYASIVALSDDIFECQIDKSSEVIILNSKGEKVK